MAADDSHDVRLARLVNSPPSEPMARQCISFSTTSDGDSNSVKLPRYLNTLQTAGEDREDGSGPDISDNWMLQDSLEKSRKQFESMKVKLVIRLPGRSWSLGAC